MMDLLLGWAKEFPDDKVFVFSTFLVFCVVADLSFRPWLFHNGHKASLLFPII